MQNSLANLELVFAVGLQKYGHDELVERIHTQLLGLLYDGIIWPDGFLDDVTLILNKRLLLKDKHDAIN